MSIIDHLTNYLAPHDCLACGEEGALVCRRCWSRHVKTVPERCYRCYKVSPAGLTCPSCRPDCSLHALRACTSYEGLAKALIWQLKFKGAQAAAGEIAGRMKELIAEEPNMPYVVPVPTGTARVRRRGYDQAKLLARQLSRRSHLAYADCLRRRGQTHQIGASRQQRLQQLGSAFYTVKLGFPVPERVILIDDVVTTGATLEAAAKTLKTAGVKCVEAMVFARA